MLRVKFILETIISTLFYFSGLNWLYTKITAKGRNIPIIFYHEIGNNDKDGLTEFSVSADHFERQIQWLSRYFNVVSIDQLIRHINGEIKLPGKVTGITFDGGYVGNYQYAFPILKKYNVPAAIYVVTDSVDGNIPWERNLLYLISLTKKEQFRLTYRGKEHEFEIKTRSQKRSVKKILQDYMSGLDNEEQGNLLKQISQNLNVQLFGLAQKLFLSWHQIREMNKGPLITIGSHSLTHPRLTYIPLEKADREILEPKIRIENKLGEEITSFCYPDNYFSKEVINLVKNAGYSSALAVATRGILNDLNKIGDDVFELRRICMPDRSYIPLLAVELSGLMRIIKKAGK